MLKIMNLGPIECVSVRIFFIKVCFSELNCLNLGFSLKHIIRFFDVRKDLRILIPCTQSPSIFLDMSGRGLPDYGSQIVAKFNRENICQNQQLDT